MDSLMDSDGWCLHLGFVSVRVSPGLLLGGIFRQEYGKAYTRHETAAGAWDSACHIGNSEPEKTVNNDNDDNLNIISFHSFGRQ